MTSIEAIQRAATIPEKIGTYPFQIIEKQRLPKATASILVNDLIETLGISINQLSRLIGTEQNHVRKWKAGTLRISAAYCGRAIHLMALHAQGLPLSLARRYRWETDYIEWLNGNISYGDHLKSKAWEWKKEPSARRTNDTLKNWTPVSPLS